MKMCSRNSESGEMNLWCGLSKTSAEVQICKTRGIEESLDTLLYSGRILLAAAGPWLPKVLPMTARRDCVKMIIEI